MEKYEITATAKEWIQGKTLYQIRAIRDFGNVRAGHLGGFIEREANLGHEGNAWIMPGATAYGDARIYGNACICGQAIISGEARVFGDAVIGNQVHINGNARICSNARIESKADYISISGFGENGIDVTAFEDSCGRIIIVGHDFFGDLTKFRDKIMSTCRQREHAAEYFGLIRLISMHFKNRKSSPK